MAVDKNFVVKNGLEVDTNLIFADAIRNQVGIATTVTNFTFQVLGGVGATNITISNLATVLTQLRVGTSSTSFTVLASNNNVGIRTANPIFPLDIRCPVSTGQTALYVKGDAKVTGLLNVETVTFNSASLESLTVQNALTVNSPAVTQLNGYVDINNSADISGGLNVAGISTLGGRTIVNNSVDVSNNLRVSGIATAGSVSIGNTEVISSGRQLKNIVSLDAVTTDTIETVIANSPNTFTDMSVSGISTFGTVLVSSGIITARSGVVTYFGDGAYLNNTLRGIGIGSAAGLVGYGISFINLAGPLVSTCFVSPNTGIATIYFENVGPTIGIGTTPGEAGFFGEPGIGNIWYNTKYGRLFLYYSDGDSSQWVDASPSNTGIITSLSNISFYRGSALSPSVYIVDDNQTGVFSPGEKQITFVSAGSSILNINNSGIRVTGVSTFNGSVVIGSSTTALSVNGDIRVTGVSTFNNSIAIGSSASISSSGNALFNGGLTVGAGATISSSGNVSFDGGLSVGAGGTVIITTSSGQFGIGVTPQYGAKFEVGGSSIFYTVISVGTTNQSGSGNFVGGTSQLGGEANLLVQSSNAATTPTTIYSNSSVGTLQVFSGGLGSASRRGGQIDYVGGASTGGYAGQLLFRTGIETSGTAQSITARLDTSGVMYATTFSDSNGNVRNTPQNSQSSAYILTVSDVGKHVAISTGGVTVPSGVFSVGDNVSIYNNSAFSQSILQGASATMYLAGTATTGTRSLAQRGICNILCVASNTFVISGSGLT